MKEVEEQSEGNSIIDDKPTWEPLVDGIHRISDDFLIIVSGSQIVLRWKKPPTTIELNQLPANWRPCHPRKERENE